MSRHTRGRTLLTAALIDVLVLIVSQGCGGSSPPTKVADSTPPTRRQEQAAEKAPAERGSEQEAAVTQVEQSPPESQAAEEDAAAKRRAADFSTPAPDEVSEAVKRVFKDSVSVMTYREPYFVAGDFNGDQSQDLAVVVTPAAGALAEMNDELAGWILVAPTSPAPERASAAEARRRVLVNDGDVLLAVIHGYESKGWRDPRATQTYVLKDAAGEVLKARRKDSLAGRGRSPRLPRLWGDVIAQGPGGESAFLYYNGAKYAHFDPRRDRPPATPRIAHGMSPAQALR